MSDNRIFNLKRVTNQLKLQRILANLLKNGLKKGKTKGAQEEIAAVGEQKNYFSLKLQANKFSTPNQTTSVPQNTAQRQPQGNFQSQRQQREGQRPQSQSSSRDNQEAPQPLQGRIFQLSTIPMSPKNNSGLAQDSVPTAQDQPIPNCRKCQQLGHKVTQCPQIYCRTCNALGHMSWACPKNPKREFSCYRCGYQSGPIFFILAETPTKINLFTLLESTRKDFSDR